MVRRRGQLADVHTHHCGPHTDGVAESWIERPRCEHLYREESPGGIYLVPSSAALVTGQTPTTPHDALHWRQPLHTYLTDPTPEQHFKEMSDKDRRTAIRFLRRGDVQVLTWYQRARDNRPGREAHLKVWAMMSESRQRRGHAGSVEAMLVGSGNLTKAGLLHNEEAFAHATGEDLRRIGAQLERLRSHQWKRKDKILEYIRPEAVAERPGCLASLLPAFVAATLAAIARSVAAMGRIRIPLSR